MVLKSRRDWNKVVKRKASIEKASYEPKMEMRAGLKKAYECTSGNKSKIEQAAGF